MRRRCKEALRLEVKEWNERRGRASSDQWVAGSGKQESVVADGKNQTLERKVESFQLMLGPRSSSLDVPFTDIRSDVRAFLSSRIHGFTQTQ